jgi:hypothetical protein
MKTKYDRLRPKVFGKESHVAVITDSNPPNFENFFYLIITVYDFVLKIVGIIFLISLNNKN